MFVDHSVIRFGTDSKIKGQDNITRNLLMASIQIDSAIISDPHGHVTASRLKAGVGSTGEMHNLMDTTAITPLGGRITLGRFTMLSLPDSTQMQMSGMETNASIRRFQGLGRTPILSFGIKADRIRYWDRTTMMSLREAQHTAERKQAREETKLTDRGSDRLSAASVSQSQPRLSEDNLQKRTPTKAVG